MPSAFLAVWLPEGTALPEAAIARVERALPFTPDRTDSRSSGTATLWSWRLDEHLSGADQWSSIEGGAAAIAGYGIDAEGERLEARDLCAPGGLADAWSRFHGEWSACALVGGAIAAGSSAIGTEPLQVVETKRFVAVASRARLLWELMQAFGETRAPDLETLAMLLAVGHPFCTEGTAVRGVRLVDPTTRLRVDTGGECRLEPNDPAFFLPRPGAAPPDWAKLARSASRSFAWMAGRELPTICAITGGKDSRLVIALLRAAGQVRKVDRFSLGAPADHADAIVARSIAERFGLTFERTETHPDVDLASELTTHVAFSEGLVDAWDLASSTRYSPRIHIHGLFGEIYRGRPSTLPDPRAVARAILPSHADAASLLQPEVLAEQLARIAAWIRDAAALGVDLRLSRDAFYLRQKVPRWVGQAQLRARLEGLQFNPLLSIEVLRAFWGLSAEDRWGERVHFELMASAWPELLELPFAFDRWNPDMVRRSSRPTLQIPEPVRHARPMLGTGWQVPTLRARFAEVAGRIDGCLSTLEPVVSPERVRALLDVVALLVGARGSAVAWARAGLRSPLLLARARRDRRAPLKQTMALLTMVELCDMLARAEAAIVRVA